MTAGRWGAVAIAAVVLLSPAAAAAAPAGTITRVSVPMPFSGPAADGAAGPDPSISADGRWVAFGSSATNLVPGDTNGVSDVFVRDTLLARTVRVSVGPGGAQAGRGSSGQSLSADGRYVAFASEASNLVSGDTNGTYDVFVRDLRTGTTTLVSRTPTGAPGDRRSFAPDISADGRVVAFGSDAADLVPGDANDSGDVFVHDLTTGTTDMAPRAGFFWEGPAQDPSISGDGSRVTYVAGGGSQTPVTTDESVFLYDRTTRTTTEVSAGLHDTRYLINTHHQGRISDDGRFVVLTFVGWRSVSVDPVSNVHRYDVATRRLRLVSGDARGRPTTAVGGSAGPAVSAAGRYVAFNTDLRLVPADTDTRTDVYRWDATNGRFLRLTNGRRTQGVGSQGASISASGNRIAFFSDSTGGLAPGTTAENQIYLWSAAG